MRVNIKVTECVYHRNGVGGQGFFAIKFDWHYDNGSRGKFVATVLSSLDVNEYESETFTGQCFVLQVKNGTVSVNDRWRGDEVENELRKFLTWRDKNRDLQNATYPSPADYYEAQAKAYVF